MREIIISSEVLLLLPFLPLSVPRPPRPAFFCASGAAGLGWFGPVGSCSRGDFTNRENGTDNQFWPKFGENTALSWCHLAKSGTDKM